MMPRLMLSARLMLRSNTTAVATVGRRAAYTTNKKTFPSFVKYGTRAAFQVQPVAAVYSPVQGRDYLKTKRLGSMMLSWAAAGEPNKNYSYNDKVFFALSPVEVGLVLEVLDGKLGEVTLTHSPNINAKVANEKDRRSLLDVKRVAGPDGHPHTEFKLATTSDTKGEIEESVALNAGESRVLKELLSYSLPRLYGFHNVLEGSPIVDGNDGNDNNWSNNNSNGGANRSRAPASGNRGAAAEWPF